MTTRDAILQLADRLIREKGYNAFSFHDISKSVGIKTASIHYHFPTKSDLGVAVIDHHLELLNAFCARNQGKTPLEKVAAFIDNYFSILAARQVCLVGALGTDYNTLDGAVQQRLQVFSTNVLQWLTDALEEGRQQGVLHFDAPARIKALMIITNLMGIVQLDRLFIENEFQNIKRAIIQELQAE
jgi:AcrR family transcriptional regulator